jgi:hypothetical protein
VTSVVIVPAPAAGQNTGVAVGVGDGVNVGDALGVTVGVGVTDGVGVGGTTAHAGG